MTTRLGRFHGFLLASGLLIGGVVLVAGILVGRFLDSRELRHEEEHTAKVVRTQARQHLAPENFAAPRAASDSAVFAAFLPELPDIFRIKVYDAAGRIVWSDEPRLVGLAFPGNPHLQRALRGDTTTTVLEVAKDPEHVYERSRGYVIETYVPITLPGRAGLVGVIETYKAAGDLVAGIHRAQRQIWGTAGGVGLFLYLALALIVRTAWRNEQRALAAIQDAHERLAVILSAIADRMVIIDRNMGVVWLNEAAAAAAERSPTELLGRPCFEILDAAADQCQECPGIRTLLSGRVERGMRRQRLRSGEMRYLDLVTAPIRDESGRVYQILEVARDITALVEMEERLKQSAAGLERSHAELVTKTEELEQAYRTLGETQAQLVEKERLAAVGQVVVSLHHSILNPLAGVLGVLQLLKDGDLAPASRAESLLQAEREVRRIERLVRQLPRLSHLRDVDYVGDTTMLDLEASEPEQTA